MGAPCSRGLGLTLAGLYDAAEEDHVRRSLERFGMATCLSRADLEAVGFFACDADLEDKLIRALGVGSVEAVLETQGELPSFRRFHEQPAQRDRSLHAQLHRFMGTRARRKVRYGSLLTAAIDPTRMPRGLELVVDYARTKLALA